MRRTVTGLVVLIAAAGSAGAGSNAVTIAAQPPVLRAADRVNLFGAISSPKAGELVTVLGRECGVPGGFHAVGGTQTDESGRWTIQQPVRSGTVFRAVWRAAQSQEVRVQQRAAVGFFERVGGIFLVRVFGVIRFEGKQVTIERYDPHRRAWTALKAVVLGPSEFLGAAERRGIRVDVPRGTTLRAVLPLSQARPCYLAGYSALVRT